MVEIVTKEQLEQLKKEHKNVVVDFFAKWCGPCKMVSAHIDKTQEEVKDVALIVKVDIEQSPELAAEFGVRSIPTFAFINEEKVVDTHVGLLSQKQLVDRIKFAFK